MSYCATVRERYATADLPGELPSVRLARTRLFSHAPRAVDSLPLSTVGNIVVPVNRAGFITAGATRSIRGESLPLLYSSGSG
jgi:hypothetical protein